MKLFFWLSCFVVVANLAFFLVYHGITNLVSGLMLGTMLIVSRKSLF